MSRILEFQPTDEQTVVARVLVELHQAIDLNFPGANPSNRQFSKTVLTNQVDSTRVDSAPVSGTSERGISQQPGERPAFAAAADTANLSFTPKSQVRGQTAEAPLQTADLQRLMGESPASHMLKLILVGFLVAGAASFLWLVFIGTDGIPENLKFWH